MPSNFEHRVHTGFDKNEGRYVGLPLQWASIVGNNQKPSNRPLPVVDPSQITVTEILDLKTIVRHQMNNNHKLDDSQQSIAQGGATTTTTSNGIVLPKTSHVARSNSLRGSPPRIRRDIRGNANFPPSVPEEPTAAQQLAQFPSMRRDPNYASKLQLANGAEWNGVASRTGQHQQQQQQQYLGAGGGGGGQGDPAQHALPPPAFQTVVGQNGNSVNPINVHTDLLPHQFR